MAHRDVSVTAVNPRKTGRDVGYITVTYRNVAGKTRSARVVSAGSTSGLKLLVGSGPSRLIVDNVPLATGERQTNVYLNRT